MSTTVERTAPALVARTVTLELPAEAWAFVDMWQAVDDTPASVVIGAALEVMAVQADAEAIGVSAGAEA